MAEVRRRAETAQSRTDAVLAEERVERAETRQAGAHAERGGQAARADREPAREGGLMDMERGVMRFAQDTVAGAACTLGAAATGTVGVAREVIDETLDAVADVGGHAVSSVQTLAGGLLRGAANVGGEAAGVVGGALRGAAGAGAEAAQAAGGILRGAADFGAEAASGAMAAGRGVGAATGGAVKDLAVGAIDVVDVVGQSAVRTATGLMVGVIAGLKEVLRAATPGESTRRSPIGTSDRARERAAEKTL